MQPRDALNRNSAWCNDKETCSCVLTLKKVTASERPCSTLFEEFRCKLGVLYSTRSRTICTITMSRPQHHVCRYCTASLSATEFVRTLRIKVLCSNTLNALVALVRFQIFNICTVEFINACRHIWQFCLLSTSDKFKTDLSHHPYLISLKLVAYR